MRVVAGTYVLPCFCTRTFYKGSGNLAVHKHLLLESCVKLLYVVIQEEHARQYAEVVSCLAMNTLNEDRDQIDR
jgi:hypothetical protein